jgi:glycosyltransferase 2 family protein
MPQRLKSVIKYLLILGATVFLVWFSLRGLTVSGTGNTFFDKWNYLYKTWQQSDKGWLLLMAGIFMISQLVRAERWRMLLKSAGSSATFHQSLLALLTGYLVNLVVPRGGEVTRCYSIHQFSKTPVEVSLGTVIVERILDVICLLTIVALAFVFQTEMLLGFIQSLPIGEGNENSKYTTLLFIAAIGSAAVAILIFLIYRNEKLKERLKKIVTGFVDGLLSIRKLHRPGLFIFYSVFIWVLYFTMSYTVMLAFTSTSELGMGAVLSVFALGSIAMAAPLPGGAGAYHTIVPAGLTFLYNIPPTDAIAFVFVFHAWQTLLMIVSGASSMIATSFAFRQK